MHQFTSYERTTWLDRKQWRKNAIDIVGLLDRFGCILWCDCDCSGSSHQSPYFGTSPAIGHQVEHLMDTKRCGTTAGWHVWSVCQQTTHVFDTLSLSIYIYHIQKYILFIYFLVFYLFIKAFFLYYVTMQVGSQVYSHSGWCTCLYHWSISDRCKELWQLKRYTPQQQHIGIIYLLYLHSCTITILCIHFLINLLFQDW